MLARGESLNGVTCVDDDSAQHNGCAQRHLAQASNRGEHSRLCGEQARAFCPEVQGCRQVQGQQHLRAVEESQLGIGVEGAVDGKRQHGKYHGNCELRLQVVVEAHEHDAQAHDPDELCALRVVDAVGCEEGQLHGGPLVGPSGYVHEEGVGPGDEGAGEHRQRGDRPQGQVHDE